MIYLKSSKEQVEFTRLGIHGQTGDEQSPNLKEKAAIRIQASATSRRQLFLVLAIKYHLHSLVRTYRSFVDSIGIRMRRSLVGDCMRDYGFMYHRC